MTLFSPPTATFTWSFFRPGMCAITTNHLQWQRGWSITSYTISLYLIEIIIINTNSCSWLYCMRGCLRGCLRGRLRWCSRGRVILILDLLILINVEYNITNTWGHTLWLYVTNSPVNTEAHCPMSECEYHLIHCVVEFSPYLIIRQTVRFNPLLLYTPSNKAYCLSCFLIMCTNLTGVTTYLTGLQFLPLRLRTVGFRNMCFYMMVAVVWFLY